MFDDSTEKPARRRRRKDEAKVDLSGISAEDLAIDDSAAAEEAVAVDVVVEEPAAEPAADPAESRDIGNWRFTPWKGIPMWTHKDTIRTSFDEALVRKHRHQ